MENRLFQLQYIQLKIQIKKLKAGKKYFVRVRAYNITKGKKKYTKWSKVKSIKCK